MNAVLFLSKCAKSHFKFENDPMCRPPGPTTSPATSSGQKWAVNKLRRRARSLKKSKKNAASASAAMTAKEGLDKDEKDTDTQDAAEVAATR